MYEKLKERLKNLATLEVKNGESYLNVTAEATAAIREIAQEAADAVEKLQKALDDVNDAHNEGYDVGYWAGRRDYEPTWISVTERLPKGADESGEICENVWLLFDDGCVYPGWMNGITKKVYYLDDMNDVVMRAPISRVRAWQPGPTPPKMDEDESEGEDNA